MKKKLLLILTILCAAPLFANADNERYHRNALLLDLLEQYEAYSTIYDEAQYYSFLELFENEETLIFCDLMEYRFGQLIPVREYASVLKERENALSAILNVTRSEYKIIDGRLHSILELEKSIIYNDSNGILFSTEEYFQSKYLLQIDCVYDSESDSFKICGITGQMKSTVDPLPEKFVVLQKNGKKDPKFLRGREFNSYDQAFIPTENIDPWTSNVFVKKDVLHKGDNYLHLKATYTKAPLRLNVSGKYAVKSVYEMTTSRDLNLLASTGYEYGAELGLCMPFGKGFNFNIYVGAGYSFSTAQIGMSGYKYSFPTISSQGDAYSRQYQFSELVEDIEYTHLYFPLYASFEIKLAKRVYMTLLGGVKGYYYLGSESHMTANGSVSASYGGNMTFTSKDALGPIDMTYNRYLFVDKYDKDIYDRSNLSIIAGGGLSIEILKRRLFVNLRCTYESGLTSEVQSPAAPANRFYAPFVYSEALGDNVPTENFDAYYTLRRSAIWPEIGLTVKFF